MTAAASTPLDLEAVERSLRHGSATIPAGVAVALVARIREVEARAVTAESKLAVIGIEPEDMRRRIEAMIGVCQGHAPGAHESSVELPLARGHSR